MADLVYSAITSLDGFINDESGGFDWAAPDEEVHAFVNDEEGEAGTYLYGRRMYEVMEAWETLEDDDAVTADYARIWRAADKVVYSTTLDDVRTARTTLRPAFDPDEVRTMKAQAARPLTIGGPTLAAEAFRAGLVDECRVFLNPIVVGGGTSWLPAGVHVPLELVDQRRFAGGVVYLAYRVR